ncbi:Acetyl-CoA acetyltransferase [Thermovenabulum gondwanense]|uniref:Acetyl-CoA acetyltransferase n=2 Tax=Thermovenabulum gondwanense TaxID=520767 RepID=A0A161QAE1_9FIRM|nr:Acetyl-CoA acetyltransferase [Thermovenabulum gondwanense]
MGVMIIGTGHTKFGRLNESLYDLIIAAGREALEDAKIEAKQIGGIFVGNYSGGGFNNQEHLAPWAIEINPELRFKPCTRIENACASGSAAIKAAKNAIEAGEMDFALVIGVEKMTTLDTKGVTKVLAMASYWPEEGAKGMTFPGLFAQFALGYKEKYKITDEKFRESLAKVSAKNHTNGKYNPLAQMGKELSCYDILNLPDEKNPIIAEPLRLYDCSLVSDGAAAVVLSKEEFAKDLKDELVEISALIHTTDYLPLSKRYNWEFTAGKKAVMQAYEKARITVEDVDFAEVHDCFTIAEILAYEALGFAKDGEGYKLLDEGLVYPDGKWPVNVSGGLKAKGHPVGATGVSMAVLATRQLLGKAIGIQLKDCEIGVTFNIGGSAASNYVLVLKRVC